MNCKQTKSVRIEQLDIVERFLPTKMFPETTLFHGEKYFRRLCMRDRFVENAVRKQRQVQRNHFSRKQCMLHCAAFARPSKFVVVSACCTGHVSKFCSGRSTCSRCTICFVCASTTCIYYKYHLQIGMYTLCIMLEIRL